MGNLLTNEYLFIIGPTAVLSLALAGVAIAYIFLLAKLGKTEKDKVFLQSKIRDQTADILKDAHEKRLRIIQEATDKAHEMLKETQNFSVDSKSRFSTDMESIRKRQEELVILRTEEISKVHEQFSLSLQRSTEVQFKAMANNMEAKAIAEVEDFRKTLEGERIFMQKQLSTKVDEEYKRAQKNIEDYKVGQMKKLDRQVFDIIHALTREVLGRSLTIQDHEDLVQKALVQMKMDMNTDG